MGERPGLDTWLARLVAHRGLVDPRTLTDLVGEVRAQRAQGATLAGTLLARGILERPLLEELLAELGVRPASEPRWAPGFRVDDYVLVWKNRIWVFLADEAGSVDLEGSPDQLLKVSATDQMAAVLLPLNDDAAPDLVLFKYKIPSIARRSSSGIPR